MRERSGLPIAAYLGMLVALALAGAFVAVVFVVIWLPPRPPDVMRADIVAEHYLDGYEHMKALGHPIPHDMMQWEVRSNAPNLREARAMDAARAHLAQSLHLRPEQLRVAASHVAQSDVIVFRVRDMEEGMPRDIERRVHIEGDEISIHPAPPAVGRGEHGSSSYTFSYSNDDEDAEAPQATPSPTPPPPRREGAEAPEAPEPPTPPMPPEPPHFAPAPPGVVLISGFEIAAQLPDGRWLSMRQGRNWAELSWIVRAALVIGSLLTLLSLLALLFARRLTRPIRNFSDAVQAVGVDPQSEPVREEGPRELRGAARAVNTMQARLRSLIADRTKTLAAVAHDMRTPLMRLRLQAENAPPEQRERMAKEIAEVEALVASFIAFARDDPAEEARVRLDLSALLQSIADDHAEHSRKVSFEGEDRLVITGQSLGLKRLFANLVDNALKYGSSAHIKLMRDEAAIIVDVGDDGPGVPVDQRQSVFEPFVRLNEEGVRGAGLGLAAARSIARAHGGEIAILDADKGALIRVTLPA